MSSCRHPDSNDGKCPIGCRWEPVCWEFEEAPTRKEKEFLASEFDKCFGTAPRSDE